MIVKALNYYNFNFETNFKRLKVMERNYLNLDLFSEMKV